MLLLEALEKTDFTLTFRVLIFIGAMAGMYVMNYTTHYCIDRRDPPLVRWGNRIGYAGLSLSLLYTLTFGLAREWQPWFPIVLLTGFIDLLLIMRTIAMHKARARARAAGVDGLIQAFRAERGWASSGFPRSAGSGTAQRRVAR